MRHAWGSGVQQGCPILASAICPVRTAWYSKALKRESDNTLQSIDPLSAGSFRKNGRRFWVRPSRTGGIGPNSRTSSGRMKPVQGSLRKKTGECGKRGGTAVSDVRNRTKIIVLVK